VDETSQLVLLLRNLYAHSICDNAPWGARLQSIAEQAMNDGIYCELFRIVLCEPTNTAEDTQAMLVSTIKELDPSTAIPNREMCDQIYIGARLQELLANDTKTIEIAHDLLIRVYHNDHYINPNFMDLSVILSVYYQWWAGDSEWMIGDQLESSRIRTISELQTAASEWLAKHYPCL
jgi:hypothetical protein